MHTYKLATSIFDGPMTTLLSILCIFTEVLSRAYAKVGGGGGALVISCLAVLLVFFQVTAGAASMAVKWLILLKCLSVQVALRYY